MIAASINHHVGRALWAGGLGFSQQDLLVSFLKGRRSATSSVVVEVSHVLSCSLTISFVKGWNPG